MEVMDSREISKLLGMTQRGFIKLVHKLDIPHQINRNKFTFDLNVNNHFFKSVKQAIVNPHLRVIYSLKNIADLLQKDKKTVKTMLIENDIKIHRNGRKLIVFLVDLQSFRELTKKSVN